MKTYTRGSSHCRLRSSRLKREEVEEDVVHFSLIFDRRKRFVDFGLRGPFSGPGVIKNGSGMKTYPMGSSSQEGGGGKWGGGGEGACDEEGKGGFV